MNLKGEPWLVWTMCRCVAALSSAALAVLLFDLKQHMLLLRLQHYIPVILCFALQGKLLVLGDSRVSLPVAELDPEFVRLLSCQSVGKIISEPVFAGSLSKPLITHRKRRSIPF